MLVRELVSHNLIGLLVALCFRLFSLSLQEEDHLAFCFYSSVSGFNLLTRFKRLGH